MLPWQSWKTAKRLTIRIFCLWLALGLDPCLMMGTLKQTRDLDALLHPYTCPVYLWMLLVSRAFGVLSVFCLMDTNLTWCSFKKFLFVSRILLLFRIVFFLKGILSFAKRVMKMRKEVIVELVSLLVEIWVSDHWRSLASQMGRRWLSLWKASSSLTCTRLVVDALNSTRKSSSGLEPMPAKHPGSWLGIIMLCPMSMFCFLFCKKMVQGSLHTEMMRVTSALPGSMVIVALIMLAPLVAWPLVGFDEVVIADHYTLEFELCPSVQPARRDTAILRQSMSWARPDFVSLESWQTMVETNGMNSQLCLHRRLLVRLKWLSYGPSSLTDLRTSFLRFGFIFKFLLRQTISLALPMLFWIHVGIQLRDVTCIKIVCTWSRLRAPLALERLQVRPFVNVNWPMLLGDLLKWWNWNNAI